ncbi:MAG TPA: hypothetical protein DDX11_01380 [Candidatus Peribacter riflensis]|nr:hypothetical protein [Candidatus Peribacter riflensis]
MQRSRLIIGCALLVALAASVSLIDRRDSSAALTATVLYGTGQLGDVCETNCDCAFVSECTWWSQWYDWYSGHMYGGCQKEEGQQQGTCVWITSVQDSCWVNMVAGVTCPGGFTCGAGTVCMPDGSCATPPAQNCGSNGSASSGGTGGLDSSSSTGGVSSGSPQQQCMALYGVSACPGAGACFPAGTYPCAQVIPCCNTSGSYTNPSLVCCPGVSCDTQSNTCVLPVTPGSSSPDSIQPSSSSSVSSSSSSQELLSCCLGTSCFDNMPADACAIHGSPAAGSAASVRNGICAGFPCQPDASSSPAESSSSQTQLPSSSSSSSVSSRCADSEKRSCCYNIGSLNFCNDNVCPDECRAHGVEPYGRNGVCKENGYAQSKWGRLFAQFFSQSPVYCPTPEAQKCCRTDCQTYLMPAFTNPDSRHARCVGESAAECKREKDIWVDGVVRKCAPGSMQPATQCTAGCNTSPPEKISCCMNPLQRRTEQLLAAACSSRGGFPVTDATPCSTILCCTNAVQKTIENLTAAQCSSKSGAFAVQNSSQCGAQSDCATIPVPGGSSGETYLGCIWKQNASECSWQIEGTDITVALDPKPVTKGVCCCPAPETKTCCRMVSTPTAGGAPPYTTSWQCTHGGNADGSPLPSCGMQNVGGTIYHPGTVIPGNCADKCNAKTQEGGCCCNVKNGTFAGNPSLWISYNSGYGTAGQSPAEVCSSFAGSFVPSAQLGMRTCNDDFCSPQGWCCTADGPKKMRRNECNTSANAGNFVEGTDASPPADFCLRPCCSEKINGGCSTVSKTDCNTWGGTFKSDARSCSPSLCGKYVPCCITLANNRYGCVDSTFPAPTTAEECKQQGRKQLSGDKCPTGKALQERCGGSEEKVSCCERTAESAPWTCAVKNVNECNNPTNQVSLGKASADTCPDNWQETCKQSEETVACCPIESNGEDTARNPTWTCTNFPKPEKEAKCQKNSDFGKTCPAGANCYKPFERQVGCCSIKGTCWHLSLAQGQKCDSQNGVNVFYSDVFDPPDTCTAQTCTPANTVACCKRDSETDPDWSCSPSVSRASCTGSLMRPIASTTCPANLNAPSACGPIKLVPCCKKTDNAYTCTAQSPCDEQSRQIEGDACPTDAAEVQRKCQPPEKQVACCARESEFSPWGCAAVAESQCVNGPNVKSLGEAAFCPENWKQQCPDTMVACCGAKPASGLWTCQLLPAGSCVGEKRFSTCTNPPQSCEEVVEETPVACCPKEGGFCKQNQKREDCDDEKPINEVNSCDGVSCAAVQEVACCVKRRVSDSFPYCQTVRKEDVRTACSTVFTDYASCSPAFEAHCRKTANEKVACCPIDGTKCAVTQEQNCKDQSVFSYISFVSDDGRKRYSASKVCSPSKDTICEQRHAAEIAETNEADGTDETEIPLIGPPPTTGFCSVSSDSVGVCFDAIAQTVCEGFPINGTFHGELPCFPAPAPNDADHPSADDPLPAPETVTETEDTPSSCGDGIVNANPAGRPQERCDDGNRNSDTEPGACDTDCTYRNTFLTIGQLVQDLQIFIGDGAPISADPETYGDTRFFIIIGLALLSM